jgi:hypothetical protein
MPDNVKFKSPVIPNPPTEYNQSLFQRTFNILRIYFNQLDNHLRGELGNTTVDGFLEVTDADAGTKEKPIIALYRNSPSPANSDKLGAIRWFGQADSGEKKLFGQIYTKAADIGDASEQGEMVFTVAADNGLTSAVADAVTDITADIANDIDPAFTITQNEVKIPGTSSFMIDGFDNGGLFKFKESGGNVGSVNFVDITGNRAVQFPDASGTVALTDVTNTAEFFEIASATASSADNACHPVLSIYDNADRSSQSNNPSGGLNNSGALRFYFNNKAGDKSFAAGMRALAIDIEDGEERGGIEFCLPTGSAGDVVTDVTASHSNIESPVMSLFKYGLVMAANNDIFLHDNDDVIKWSGASQSLRARATETSGTSTITLPDATGTLPYIADNGGLQHPALSSNPSSPANGQTYYNTTDHKLKLYANGAWVDLN